MVEYGALAKDEDGNTLGAMLPVTADMDDFYPYYRLYKTMTLEGREYNCYLFYKRTHTMDTKEMARLIDGAIYVAKGLGIDTDTPEQIARYKEEWQPWKKSTATTAADGPSSWTARWYTAGATAWFTSAAVTPGMPLLAYTRALTAPWGGWLIWSCGS